jgi:hypothetical protein
MRVLRRARTAPFSIRALAGASVASMLVVAAACAGGNDSSNGTKPPSPGLSGSPDAGTFAFAGDAGNDAGDLLVACDPSNPGSCPTGFTCFPTHSSASWWVDLYGKCTFDCTNATYALCDSLDGVCGCPVPQGSTSANCSAEGGVSMVCVPALKPGTTPGADEADGGCGTPGCSGGPALPALDGSSPTPEDAGGAG